MPQKSLLHILEREKSSQDEQEVIDVVSQFVVLRASDRSLTFLHNLIPAWLTNKEKAVKLFIDKRAARESLRRIFTEILSAAVNEPLQSLSSIGEKLQIVKGPNYFQNAILIILILTDYLQVNVPPFR